MRVAMLCFDPVCGMVVSPVRAREEAIDHETTFYFCSANCRDCFVHYSAYYLERRALEFGGLAAPEHHDHRGDAT